MIPNQELDDINSLVGAAHTPITFWIRGEHRLTCQSDFLYIPVGRPDPDLDFGLWTSRKCGKKGRKISRGGQRRDIFTPLANIVKKARKP